MTEEHPNVALLKQLDPGNVAGTADVFAEDVVWHFFNPLLPDMQGDYVGRSGVQDFFEQMAKQTDGTFRVNPVSVTAVGDELLVTQSKNTMVMKDQQIEIDVVVVWRIVDGRISEVWDIPSVHHAQTSQA
ncbi:nuclear transport factor 2 family protein [Gimesia aquarii]|uniref:SnoaL-like domain protein n=1 Tax=Gimesia aquarii TaxID=2527964 RepID=A0A517WNZ5_9PLAN|nr:nuclear transport factor 2 family protein [Gimesia aquarii]QDU06977.1 SnoaL-like domain protein [Gimesia aquarii]